MTCQGVLYARGQPQRRELDKEGSNLMIFRGRITSSGFESGDSLVIGDWIESPLGSFTNIMWSKPDGRRVLLSPSPEHADFVSSLYYFDEVVVTEIIVNRKRKAVSIKTDYLQASMSWGCLLYTSPSPRDGLLSRMPSSA